MIRAENASLVYYDHGREIFACRDISMQVHEGEFVGILGPSGSGKSSLLYLLSGLKDPTMGEVKYLDKTYESLSEGERSQLRLSHFGFVFQQPFLLGYLTAIENVLLVGGDSSKAYELFERLGIAEKAHRMPAELSGGEKQRVCVARALFASPKVVFADEPTASLDHASGSQVVDLLSKNRQGALVMVTHDPSMLTGADRVFHIDSGVAMEAPLSRQL